MTKNELRFLCKSKRNSLQNDGTALCEKIKTFSAFQNCDTLLCYYPIGSEADILPIAKYAFATGKRLAFPRCISQTETEFYFVNSITDLTEGKFGIPEPAKENRLTHEYSQTHKCVALIPGLCFDRYGNRLGYGKGYYDRYLPKINSVNIGVCNSQLLFENIPCSEYDYKIDYILSEKGVIKRNEV